MELKVITGKFTKGQEEPTHVKESLIELKTVKKRWYHRLVERWFGGRSEIAIPIAKVRWDTYIGLDAKGKLQIQDSALEVMAQEINYVGYQAINKPKPSPPEDPPDHLDDIGDQNLEAGSDEKKGSYVNSLLLKYVGGEVIEENGKPLAYLYGKYPGSATRCYSLAVDTEQLLLILKHMGVIEEEFKVKDSAS